MFQERNYLIRTIVGTPGQAVEESLRGVYEVLARAWLAHWAQDRAAADGSWRELAVLVRSSAARVDLRSAQAANPLIARPWERPAKLYDSLGHMEVLLAAISLLRPLGLVASIGAPAQTSTMTQRVDFLYYDTERGQIPNLQGPGFVLEAYGGVDYTHHDKAARDLDALRLFKAKFPPVRCFAAVRREAFERLGWSEGDRLTAYRSADKGPWSISAGLLKAWSSEEVGPYVLLEVGDFRGGNPRRAIEDEHRLEENAWRRLAAEQLLRGDDDTDAVYDRDANLQRR